MKIRLVNFRCYIDKTFEFEDSKLILISAASGAGKSTILMGIQFVLYGTGTKVTSHGKTACRVEFEYEDMKIVRTKRPNRVVLNDTYEDDEAQKIINDKFGDTFETTSYISQNALNSFILKSPTDKLEFLEQFAFKDTNLSEIKNRCKSLIAQRNEVLTKTIANLEMTRVMLGDLTKPVVAEYPFKKSKHDYETLVKSANAKKNNCDILIKRARNDAEKIQKELNDIMVFETHLSNKTDNLSEINRKIHKLSEEEKDIEYKGDEFLEECNRKLVYLKSIRELVTLEEKYENDLVKLEDMKNRELKELSVSLNKLTSSIWQEYSEDELKQTIKDTKEYLKDARVLTNLEKQFFEVENVVDDIEEKKETLSEYRSQLDIQRQTLETFKKRKTVYVCPSCKTHLNLRDDKLHPTEEVSNDETCDVDEIRKVIQTLQKKIKILESEIPEKESALKRKNKLQKDIEKIQSEYDELNEESLTEDLEYLESYYKGELAKEKHKKTMETSIENGIFSSSYGMFKKDIDALEKKITNLKANSRIEFEDVLPENEDDVRQILSKEEKNKNYIERIQLEKLSLEKQKKKVENELALKTKEHISEYGLIKSSDDLKTHIGDIKLKIQEQESKKSDALNTIDKITKYDEYVKNKTNYDMWESKFTVLQKDEKEHRNGYTAAVLLKEKILEAESIAVANIVESINIHAQLYLDCFFIDNPMIVRLLPFKETKKSTKPQINVEIDYKGMECDLASLSGGELCRVVLAFTLALGEMFNTSLLLLDESTSSLDQDTTTVVFDAIKENFKDKTVLIIAHQVVEGVFDTIIKL